MVSFTDLHTLDLDPGQAFLLSLIDGQHSIDELVDIAAMPRGEALRRLADLVERGIIALR
jgi:hypothetical protein